MHEGELMAWVDPAGKTLEQVEEEFLAQLDAYFRAHPEAKPLNWVFGDEEERADGGTSG